MIPTHDHWLLFLWNHIEPFFCFSRSILGTNYILDILSRIPMVLHFISPLKSLLRAPMKPHWATSPFCFSHLIISTNYIIDIRSRIPMVTHFISPLKSLLRAPKKMAACNTHLGPIGYFTSEWICFWSKATKRQHPLPHHHPHTLRP